MSRERTLYTVIIDINTRTIYIVAVIHHTFLYYWLLTYIIYIYNIGSNGNAVQRNIIDFYA